MKRIGVAIAAYGFAAALSVLLMIWALQLPGVDLTIPFHYHGDGLLCAACTKGMTEQGWFLRNDALGMPYGMELYDFPLCDNLHLLGLKLLGSLVNPFTACNLYYLLTFPLTTLCSLLVLRHFRLSYASALLASLLFTFLPYHLVRNLIHLFLASYYLVPLMVMVVLWLYLDPGLFWMEDDKGERRFRPGRKGLVACLICMLVASAGIYYAFFGCFFVIIAGLAASLRSKRLHALATSGCLVGVTAFGVCGNLSPNLLYQFRHGPNVETVSRESWQSEVYGLKFAQLVLPVTCHRWQALDEIKTRYNTAGQGQAPLVNENDSCSLGIVGSVGFLLLLARLFWKRQGSEKPSLHDALATLNAWGFALSTVGGLGVLFALFCSPWIRCYNRICLYLAFFSLLTLAVLLDQLWRSWGRSLALRGICLLGLVLLCSLGMLDQTTGRGYFGPNHARSCSQFASDAEHVRQIEAQLPAGSMVFQLPYVPFVEHTPPGNMQVHDHLLYYLHAKQLRWSYGGVKGRLSGIWYEQLSERPLRDMVEQLCYAGFSGIAIDRDGYADDHAADLEARLAELLGAEPLVSRDQRRAFFSLLDYGYRLRRQYDEAAWQGLHDYALRPVAFLWRDGFGRLEGSIDNNWRWCSSAGELQIINLGKRSRTIRLHMEFHSAHEEPALLLVQGELCQAHVMINKNAGAFVQTLSVSPGKHSLRFTCNARRIDRAKDPRDLVFCVLDWQAMEIPVDVEAQESRRLNDQRGPSRQYSTALLLSAPSRPAPTNK
jgi:phosphoglycerol transferase